MRRIILATLLTLITFATPVSIKADTSSVLYSIAFDGQSIYAVEACYGIGQSVVYKIDYQSGNITGKFVNPIPTYGMCRAMLFGDCLYTCVQYSCIRYGELLVINTNDMTEAWRLSLTGATNPSGLCNDGENIFVGFETDPAIIFKIDPIKKDIVSRYTSEKNHNRIVNLISANRSLYATTIKPVGSVISVNDNMTPRCSSDNINTWATGIDSDGENIYSLSFSDNKSILTKYNPDLGMLGQIKIEGIMACFIKSIGRDLYFSATSNVSMQIFKCNSENLSCDKYYEADKDYCYSIIDLGENKIAVACYLQSDIQVIDTNIMQLVKKIKVPTYITNQELPENPRPVIQPVPDAQYQGSGQSSVIGNKSITSIIGKSNKSGAAMEDIEIKSPDFKMTLVIPNKTVIKTKEGGNVVAIRVIENDCPESATGKQYELQPSGVWFSNNATLSINCNSDNYSICRLDNGSWITLGESNDAGISVLATYAMIKNKNTEPPPALSAEVKTHIKEIKPISPSYISWLIIYGVKSEYICN